MCSMCHYCGAGLMESNVDNKKQGIENSLKLNGKAPIKPCKFCGEKLERENVKWHSTSPYATPYISPTTSLSSTDSCVSTCSEFSVDVNSFDRNSREDSIVEGVMEDRDYNLKEKSQNVMENNTQERSNEIEGVMEDRDYNLKEKSQNVMENNTQERSNEIEGYTVRDVEIAEGHSFQEPKADGSEDPTASSAEETEYSFPNDLDIQTWEPPEPENPQDDIDNSVTCNDDEEEQGIGIANWGEPTSMSSSKDELCGGYRFKEEKQKAMEKIMNGKFKALVGQLLKSVGVSSSDEGDDSWVDIVTSLSWEAASFLKPDAIGGNAMNPDGFVKVKCIAAGSRSQSQLIRGLVFKKHAAHKHMPTKYKNPRLLLIRGMLGHSMNALSSFDSMDQEKDYLKSKMDLINMCHPNVILVEKTVSRDIQEAILEKGMTLVLDMKLHRLERVARCTGSPILSCDDLNSQKLRQCDFIYFEKFLEEHDGAGEGGKRPTKTLMFIEGCPTRLGCTILLKGTHSDELKRIKCVMRCAVIMAYHLILETSFLVDQRAMFSTMAYHLILETSFLVDQRAMFSTIPPVNVADILPTNQAYNDSASANSSVPSLEYSAENGIVSTDIPICNGHHEKSTNGLTVESEEFSPFSYEPYNPAVFSGLSAISSSLKKVMGDSFPFASSAPYQSLSAYFGFNGRKPDGQVNNSVPILDSPEMDGNTRIEAKDHSNEPKLLNGGQSLSSPVYLDSNNDISKVDNDRKEVQSKDDINAVLDSQSILVLMSSRNALRGTVCQQSHFSHIMFYKNFDIPLGKFLQDNLLNQTRLCDTCQELPEAHLYYYAHHNKQLTIQVKRLPQEFFLAGEAEGKIWMWSRCGKCKSCSTKRVLISTTARSLSFGKFLELSLSHYSSSRKLSCGHSLDRDFLYFFGLGHMVAVFRYSSVTTYTVSMPFQKLEFSGAIRQEWLLKETENVHMKGISLFAEIANCLKTIQFDGSACNRGSIREFSEVEKMLKQEREEFEVNIKAIVAKKGDPDRAAFKLLSLNRLVWDLLIESFVWDRRFYSLRSPEKVMQENSYSKVEGTAGRQTASMGNFMEDGYVNGDANVKLMSDTSVEVNEPPIKEIPISGHPLECNEQDDPSNPFDVPQNVKIQTVDDLRSKRSSDLKLELNPDVFTQFPSANGHPQEKDFIMNHLQVHENFPAATDIQPSRPIADLKVLNKSATLHSPVSNLLDSNEWFWKPFADIRQIGIRDFQKSIYPKFESFCSSITESLPTAKQLITEECTRLHIPLKTDNHIVSDFEGEPSSIIACALALLKDSSEVTDVDEDDMRESGIASKPTESWHGSSDSDSVHSAGSTSSEESRSFRATENHSIEILMGYAKSLGREKYTVTCHYFKQFRALRNLCCPSELDYIASLSRCMNWDAKGGKSKSLFAKTLDDRFIIKEIKKTELDSFLGFSSLYFKHMTESFESGSQTCLAKVLGIYQVTKRHIKSGKEVKHDLMVMENLSYNRNITRQYDLKGALFARYNSGADAGAGDVLLDQNFVNDMNSSPLYVSHKAKRVLQRAVWNDTSFLNSINVMDYSLLVGVDSQKRELVCGIIDYLRQYTWDKHLETWMKSSLVVPKNVLPTVISPKEYKKRFRKFMSTYFLSVPDHWCSQKSPSPCKLCCSGEEDPSQQKS